MKKVIMFPGQGSQYNGMGEDLFYKYPKLVKDTDSILGYSIEELCLLNKGDKLGDTKYTQPAMYVINCLSYLNEQEKNGSPDYILGHSLGEYSALFAAGVFDFQTGLKLVKKRGELMSYYGNGCMVAVIGLSIESIRKLLKENYLEGIDIANVNSYDQIVISGLDEQIDIVTPLLSEYGASVLPLPVSGAFHSRYMGDAKLEYENCIKEFDFDYPQVPVISNVDATLYNKDNVKELLIEQITSTVNWTKSIEYLLKNNDHPLEFIEVGPKQVLTKLYNKILKDYKYTDASFDTKKKVDEWNMTNKVGSNVYIKSLRITSQTSSEALILFDHRPAIYIEGYKGYFDLEDLEFIE